MYGLGAKLGPDGGVSFVGARTDVVRIALAPPQPMSVWGPIRCRAAKCVILNVEDGDAFIEALQARIRQ